MGLDRDIATSDRATRSSVSEHNNPNIVRDDQNDLLKQYKNKHEDDTRLFLQFMEHDNYSSHTNKKYPQRIRISTYFLIDNHPSKTNEQMFELLANHQKITKLFALMMNL